MPGTVLSGYSIEQQIKSLSLWSLSSSRESKDKQAQYKVCQMIDNVKKNIAGKGGKARGEDVQQYAIRVMLKRRVDKLGLSCRHPGKSIQGKEQPAQMP